MFEILEDDPCQEDSETLRTRLFRTREGLKLVLMAWARYEDEQSDGSARNRVQQSRYDWGTIARGFLAGE